MGILNLNNDPTLKSIQSWEGNFYPRTYGDAKLAWGDVARLGSGPASPADILHEVCLVGGGRLLAVRAIGANGAPKVLAVLSMD